MHTDPVEDLPNIKFSKQLGASNPNQNFVDQRERVPVFFYKKIKFPEVNIEAEGSIWLLNKKNWGCK
jgi:hypothetical protein